MSKTELRDSRQRLEALSERWGRFVCRRRWSVIVLTVAVSAGLMSGLPRLVVDNSTDSFLHRDDPIRVEYEAFRREFGRDSLVLIAVEAPDVFAAETLERLRALHEDLEREVPFIDDMTSLVNARDTRGEGDQLFVGGLLEEWPQTEAAREQARAHALANPLLRDTLVTSDATITTVGIKLYAFAPDSDLDALGGFDDAGSVAASRAEFLSEADASAAVRAARDVIARHDAPGFRLFMAGGPVMSEQLNAGMSGDVGRFIALSLFAISGLLYLLFRRLAAVVLPMVVVVLSMLAALGLMGYVGAPVSVGTQILPSLLLAVGVCDSVHILAIYYRRLELGRDRHEAIAFTLGHSGLAIVMTSLTTAGGLASFAGAELRPVSDLGLFAPLGVLWALVYSVTLLPALLAAIPARASAPGLEAFGGDHLDRVLQALGGFGAERPVTVVALAGVILVVSFMGIARLGHAHDPLTWFPPDDPLPVAIGLLNERLDGVVTIEVVVDAGEENGLHEPVRLDQLEEIADFAAIVSKGEFRIERTISLVDIVKEIHQALNGNDPAFHTLPRDRRLVAQELLLFENSGSDDLEDFVDTGFRRARVTLRVPWTDAFHYPELLAELESGIARILGPEVEVQITGLMAMLARTFVTVNLGMVRSYSIALLVIMPLMILLIGNLRRGLLAMIPNLTPIAMTLGYMGWAGMPINTTTMLVGATLIGLVVDDTIHFMHNFRRYYADCGDAPKAIRQTLETTGRALLVTSLVLAAGFFTFLFAYMHNMFVFGAITGVTILVAFLSNVVLGPALMVLATRRERAIRA